MNRASTQLWSLGKRCPMASLLACLALGAAHADEPVIGFRNQGFGVWPDAVAPTNFDLATGKGVRWWTRLPDIGDSQAIVVGDRVFVTCEPMTLVCLGADDGKIRWQADLDPAEAFGSAELGARFRQIWTAEPTNEVARSLVGAFSKATGVRVVPMTDAKWMGRRMPEDRFAFPAPWSDGKRVYVYYSTKVVAAYDLNGKREWVRRCGAARPVNMILAGGTLMVPESPGVVGLDPATGGERWRNKKIVQGPNTNDCGWGISASFEFAGRTLVISGGGQIYDPATGEILAKVPAHGDHTSTTVAGDLVIVPAGHHYTKGQEFTYAFRLERDGANGVKSTPVWKVPEFGGNRCPTVSYAGRLCTFPPAALDVATGATVAKFFPGMEGSKMESHRPVPGMSLVGDLMVVSGSGHWGNGGIWLLRAKADKGGCDLVAGSMMPRIPMFSTPCAVGRRLYLHATALLICLEDGTQSKPPTTEQAL